MRVLIWLAALACLFHATNGMAEVAKVTSGEHSGFSRLVVTLSENAEWRFGRTKDGYALEVDQKGLIYNLEKVFTRIPKTRIAAVTPARKGRSIFSPARPMPSDGCCRSSS